MIGGVALSSLASVLVLLGFMLQTATPPRTSNPHTDPESSAAEGGCDTLVTYVDTLFTAIDEHGTFSAFWAARDYDGIQQMDRIEIEAIVDDGRALLDDLAAMDVPAPYARGHEGIQLVFGSDIDYIAFLGLDASNVPDLDQWERGIALILRGELTVAKACPDEMAEVGDFVFYDPAELETVFD